MNRIPHIVKRSNGCWNVTTTLAEFDGGYFLSFFGRWAKYVQESPRNWGVFSTEADAKLFLSNAPPVPADAVWDGPVEPAATTPPAMEWKRVADTLDELRAMPEGAKVDVLYPSGPIMTWMASEVCRFTPPIEHRWTIIPRPKPAPTETELEREVVEALEQETDYYRSVARHRPDDQRWKGSDVAGKLAEKTDAARAALLAHRKAKGGA